MTDRAPFIVTSANTSDSKTFSWPFQMTRIEAHSFARKLPLTLLAGAPADSEVAGGFAVLETKSSLLLIF